MQLHHVKKMFPYYLLPSLFVTGTQHNCTKKTQNGEKCCRVKGLCHCLATCFIFWGQGLVGFFTMNYLWTDYIDTEVKVFCAYLGTKSAFRD